jgi:glucosamine-6-phosphate deaminase
MAKYLEKEFANYEKKIMLYRGIEVFVGWIGPDGHIALNGPGSSLASRTRIKTLTYNTMLANNRFFVNDVRRVLRTTLTVGVWTVEYFKDIEKNRLDQETMLAKIS